MAVAAGMSQSSRRFVYGLNVVVGAALLVALIALAVLLSGRFGFKVDVTSSGSNSLSPRSVQLVRGLGENVTITGLYTAALKELRPHAEKHRKRVADLLDLYETAGGGKVSTAMLDPSSQQPEVNKLIKRLTEKSAFKDESKPHAEALRAYPELNKRLMEVVSADAAQLIESAKADPKLNRSQDIVAIVRGLRQIAGAAKEAEDELAKLEAEEVKRYGDAATLMQQNLSEAKTLLTSFSDWMANTGMQLPGLPPELQQLFGAARDRYAPLISDIDKQVQATANLKPVKLEELQKSLTTGENILIETENDAIAVSGNEVWTFPSDNRAQPGADGDKMVFAGEMAVSSTLLRLTQKEKTGVIFVRFGGEPLLTPDFSQFNQMSGQLPQARMGAINEAMTKENFLTAEWDVAASPTPPPLEEAKRTIFVVMPPTPPQQNPMQPQQRPQMMTPDQRKQVLDLVNASGMAIFLAGWQQPSPFNPMAAMYEYADYLKSTWGIQVKTDYLALRFVNNPNKPELWQPAQRGLVFTADQDGKGLRFTEHPIAKPLQALPAALSAACPIEMVKAESRPAGLTIDTIAEAGSAEGVWAFNNLERINKDFQERMGTRRYEDDLLGPFPLAVAAGSADGKKLVVFGSDDFISDETLNAQAPVLVGGGIAFMKLFPANTDLFINSLHWLTGDANRIAVGPSRGDVPRLTKLTPGPWLTFWQVFLVGIFPALALVGGLGVWMVRRS